MLDISEAIANELLGLNDWNNISTRELSEEFIRVFQDKINWDEISFNQILSENSKIRLIGFIYLTIKNYLKVLSENFKINWIGIIYPENKNFQRTL